MRSNIVDRSLLLRDEHAYHEAVDIARDRLRHLSQFYPDFTRWFSQKVEIGLASGERTLLMRYVGSDLAGIAVVKHNMFESKLCCLRISPEFDGSGLGLKLFEDSFEVLQTDHPLLSVCEEQLPKFQRVFKHFAFKYGHHYKNFYRSGVSEHSFNGLLSPDPINKSSLEKY
jgi:hypothetical protein